MAVEVDMLEHISDLLASGDTSSLKTLLSEKTFDVFLEEKANDIIPTASYYLTKDVAQDNPGVLRYTRKLLERCAEKGNPKECLMEFLAQIETLDEVKFQVLLKPIQTTLLRISERKAPIMMWVMSVIYSFINSLKVPSDYQLGSDSKALLDCDENFTKIKDAYYLIVDFYEPFVDEVSGKPSEEKRIKNLKLALTQALLHLLGNPVVSLDLENAGKEPSAVARLSSKIVKLILKLQPDPLKFLNLVEETELITIEEERVITKECSSNEFKFSDLSVSVFIYLVVSESVCPSVPFVYEKLYVFKNCLTLATILLRYKETLILRKGLLLTKSTIDKVEPRSVDISHLGSNTHSEILNLLSNIAIFHEVEENRKLAVELMKRHFYVFEPKAQFYMLLHIGRSSLHHKIVGFFTTILTSLVRETFDDDALQKYFTGKRLFDLMSIYCSLKEGAETDLVEHKDQILSALNLVIFLTQRDKQNTTGVWHYVPQLLSFLNQLREGINLSKAHYELELNNLNDDSFKPSTMFTATVGNEELGQISADEKKAIIKSSLTMCDLMEYLLSRANECISEKPDI